MDEVNKTIALVTGASRGLGYQLAQLLGKRGVHVTFQAYDGFELEQSLRHTVTE